MIKAIIFDLDGVLVDAVELHQDAFLEAIKPHFNLTKEEHMKDYNGLSTKQKLEKFRCNAELAEKIWNKKQEITFKLIKEKIKPIKEVQETIQKIKEMKIPFAICSNDIRKSVELFLQTAKIDSYEFSLSNEDVAKPKPHPEMYMKAIKKFGFNESEILIVEDSPTGLFSALSSGAMVCQIKNPYDIKKIFDFLEK